MALLILKICAVLYAIAAVNGVIEWLRPRDNGANWVMACLSLAMGAHVVAVGARAVELQTLPIWSLSDGLSMFGLVVAALAGVVGRLGVPQAPTFASIVVPLIVAVAVWVATPGEVTASLLSPWLPFHVAFVFLGLAAFTIAGVVSIVFLMQEGRLKQKGRRRRGEGLQRLPSLEALDRVSLRLVQVGFPLMGIGLLCGALHSELTRGEYWTWNYLNTFGVLVWVVYALLLYARQTTGWRGRQAAVLTVAGISATIVVLFLLSLSGWGPHGVG